ncbi:MAG: hypothetical protein HDR11_06760 [Lachnospiraceae bacterium]|nr:hypothetical protein [Lachnospiraceae bacterium]
MIHLKDRILGELEQIAGADISDSYPEDFSTETQIQYTEEENKADQMAGNKVAASRVRYRIDIWDKRSTSALAGMVDDRLNGNLGLTRTHCSDSNEPGRKHKIMRYEGIVYEKDGRVVSPPGY